jgi:hypothetical protein
VGTFFNRHPDGNVDKRTDIYYMETSDLGETWTDVQGNPLEIPLLKLENPARVIDYQSQGKNVYLKDMGFDSDGNPAYLYIRSNGHEPGPVSAPYEWCITRWDGPESSGWHTSVITESDHNYDMGSLYISKKDWKIVGQLLLARRNGALAVNWKSGNQKTKAKNGENRKHSPKTVSSAMPMSGVR